MCVLDVTRNVIRRLSDMGIRRDLSHRANNTSWKSLRMGCRGKHLSLRLEVAADWVILQDEELRDVPFDNQQAGYQIKKN